MNPNQNQLTHIVVNDSTIDIGSISNDSIPQPQEKGIKLSTSEAEIYVTPSQTTIGAKSTPILEISNLEDKSDSRVNFPNVVIGDKLPGIRFYHSSTDSEINVSFSSAKSDIDGKLNDNIRDYLAPSPTLYPCSGYFKIPEGNYKGAIIDLNSISKTRKEPNLILIGALHAVEGTTLVIKTNFEYEVNPNVITFSVYSQIPY